MARRSGRGGAFVAGLVLGSASACSDIVPLDCEETPTVTDACASAGTGGESSSSTSGTSTITATSASDTGSGLDSGWPTEPTGIADTGSFCGNGVVDPDEECDDGDLVDIDECSNACLLPPCGDGRVQPGEDCDLGLANDDHGACKLDCTAAICGDGYVRTDFELCDGANTLDVTCRSFGYGGGMLGCLPACDGFDLSGCTTCPDDEFCDAYQPCEGMCESASLCWIEKDPLGTCLPSCMTPEDCFVFQNFYPDCAGDTCVLPCEQECPEGMSCRMSALYQGMVCLW
jgi:cysteine-rich repeat protein